MNARFRWLKEAIARCEKITEVFAAQGIRGQEPEHYDDILAGLDTTVRNGIVLGWDLVFDGPENKRGEDPPYIEVNLAAETSGDTERVILAYYFPVSDVWEVEATEDLERDGLEAIRNLAADCRLAPKEKRQIGETEAMKIIETIAAFYMRQPAA